MAGRPFKEGLDYFELDCHLDEKMRLIQAEFGLKGFAVVVLLYKEIYGERGYYLPWDDDRLLLFMSDNGVAGGDKNLITEIIQACIRRDIFSKRLFDEYHILTSSGIQKRYLRATAKRGKSEMKKEYLLLGDANNSISSVNNSISDVNNSISDVRNTQRRVEKRRVEKSESKNENAPARPGTMFPIPTVEQVRKYCDDNGLDIDPEKFVDHYNSIGWQVKGTPIQNWMSRANIWARSNAERKAKEAEEDPYAGRPDDIDRL